MGKSCFKRQSNTLILMEAARKTTDEWCSQSLLMCQRLDQRMKSEKGIDSEGELKLLLMRLAQGK